MSTTHHSPHLEYTPLKPVLARQVSQTQPLNWLRAGWDAFMQAKVPALAFGATFAVIGALISYASLNNPQLAFTFWSGFLLIAPMLSMAIYHLAQLRERGQPAGLGSLWSLMRDNLGNSLLLVAALALVMIAWIRRRAGANV